jgi:heme/copper-type cytochrome/quinol oxidase subunit 1
MRLLGLGDAATRTEALRGERTIRDMNRLATTAVVLAAGVAVILLNLVLLHYGSSSNDPVGKLGPTAHLPTQRISPAPAGIVQPASGPIRGEGRDD